MELELKADKGIVLGKFKQYGKIAIEINHSNDKLHESHYSL